MYKLEDIKPKKYPDEKPSESGFHVSYRVLFDNGTQSLYIWNPGTPSETMMTWDRYVTWFIDIPNPPEELRFLAYPQNKPSEDGIFIAHEKPHDEWDVIRWSNNCDWDSDVIDWFIPYCLDKENEMEAGKRMIWSLNRDHKYIEFVELENENVVTIRVGRFTENTGSNNFIPVTKKELTAFAQHWLDLQGENKYKDALEWIRTWTCNDGRGYEDPVALLEKIDDYINKVFDVVKREPELLPCPVCESENTDINKYSPDEFEPICNDCGIRLMTYPTRERATEAWNTLPRKENGITQHEYDLRKGNPYDLNDVAKLTRKEE